MTDLFPQAQGESPRLRWMKKHYINSEKVKGRWHVWSPLYCAHGYGQSRVQAVRDWARKNGVRLWNEEAR